VQRVESGGELAVVAQAGHCVLDVDLHCFDLSGDTEAGIQTDAEHRDYGDDTYPECRGTGGSTVQRNETSQQNRCRSVLEEPEAAKHLSEDGTCLDSSAKPMVGLEHVEHGGRAESTECHHAADPEDERDQIQTAQGNHRGIIRGVMTTDRHAIPWLEWGADTFSRATAERKPVLLAIGAAWCRWTEEMDRVSYRDPEVVRLVTERFISIRVDADRRPDVSERYTLGGWPTTAFLTPSGEILGGGTYLEPAPLVLVLQQVSEAFATRRAEIDTRVGEPTGSRRTLAGPDTAAPVLDVDAGRWLDEQLLACFDRTWGGFGSASKRVHPDALATALVRGRDTASPDLTHVATHTLDAIATRGLWDPVEGGFFRYCDQRDWSEPHVEKVLTVNAQLLELFLSASRLLDRSDYASQATDIVRFVSGTFADPDGGFYASQRADPAYAALSSREARSGHASPPIDRTVFTAATAAMASAYVLGASVLEDSSLLEYAATSIDRVVLATYEPGAGVGHNATGMPVARGLLTDQVRVSAALLDLYDATRQEVYLDMPRELMAYCDQMMWDEAGGFTDRARTGLAGFDAPVGLLREPHRPLGLNCDAAIVLARLGASAGEPRYRDLALRTLACQTPVYREHGLDGASYVRALDQIQAVEGS